MKLFLQIFRLTSKLIRFGKIFKNIRSEILFFRPKILLNNFLLARQLWLFLRLNQRLSELLLSVSVVAVSVAVVAGAAVVVVGAASVSVDLRANSISPEHRVLHFFSRQISRF